MINLELLRKRHRELAGVTRDTDIVVDSEALAIAYKLQSQHKSITDENILIEKMKLILKDMSPRDQMKPFLTAICSMYQYALQRHQQSERVKTPVVSSEQGDNSCPGKGVEAKASGA